MSDKSDLNCFKGHILNEESTERKLYTQENKLEDFSRVSSQNQDSNLPRDKLGTSLIPDFTRADDRLVALRAKGNGDCLFNIPSLFCDLVTKTDRTSCDYGTEHTQVQLARLDGLVLSKTPSVLYY